MTDPLFPSSLLAPLFSTAAMRAVLDDRARLQRMLDFESALARAEAAVGVIPAGSANAIADACTAGRYDLAALAEAAIPAGNLAIPLAKALTAEVAKRSDKAAGYVHWGATSQDVIDTAMVLELRGVIDALFVDLDRATKAFTTLAGRHRRNMTVARTLLQQALPMPFGLKLAGYAAALARSRDRLRRLRKEALVVQFGGAAGTLAALGDKGLDVSERLAALLDLAMPDAPWHSHRDRLAEIAAALAILAGSCGKIARDVALLMQNEVAEASEAMAPGRGGSSTLPHKRNPTSATAALSAAMIAPNLAATILAGQIQEHERSVGAWQTEWVTFPALALVVSGALGAVADIAEGLNVDVERMKANLEASGGLVYAEAVSFALAEKLGRAKAHELVTELTQQAGKDKRAFKDVLAENDTVKAHISAAELERLFMPNHYQGSAQTFIDRLVASAQGHTLRRPVSHLTAPKMPTGTPKLESAPGSTLPEAQAFPAPAERPSSVAVASAALVAVDNPTSVNANSTQPVAEETASAGEKPPANEQPAVEAPPMRTEEEEPGALLEVFAKIEEFAKAAEAETQPHPNAAENERKPA